MSKPVEFGAELRNEIDAIPTKFSFRSATETKIADILTSKKLTVKDVLTLPEGCGAFYDFDDVDQHKLVMNALIKQQHALVDSLIADINAGGMKNLGAFAAAPEASPEDSAGLNDDYNNSRNAFRSLSRLLFDVIKDRRKEITRDVKADMMTGFREALEDVEYAMNMVDELQPQQGAFASAALVARSGGGPRKR